MCQPTISQKQHNGKEEDMLFLSNRRQSIVAHQRVYLEVALVFLSALYGTLLYVWQPSFLVAKGKFCGSQEDTCERRDLVAYKITSGVAFIIMAALGIYNWYGGTVLRSTTSVTTEQERLYKLQHSSSTSTATAAAQEERLFGAFYAADVSNICIVAYQTWDFAVSLTIPEYAGEPLFLFHHMLAGSAAFASWQYQVFPFYAVYFGGCAEISSIPLVIADAQGMFTILDKDYPVLIRVCQGLFVITFAYFRMVAWIRWSMLLWKDVHVAQEKGWWNTYRPGCSSAIVYVFLLLNILLTSLQIYWSVRIVQKLHSIFTEE